jgi:lipopolysaccharide transport system ATP-binding protein
LISPALCFEAVSKRFTIHHERARSFQDLLIRRFQRNGASEEFWALSDVSFSVAPGTALGIVGANGSGKSTLLKLATRILFPTHGSVTLNGRVSALLELGAGFHPELSGRDNVFLNASILGLRRRDVAARFDDIVRFAQLERFIDIPVKHYSSGMYARLGFAVAINVDPDVLLIDEVLSVGDEAFQEQCLEAIRDFHSAGKTLVLVSHDLESIRSLCDEVMWLRDGRIAAQGPSATVVGQYLADVHQRLPALAGSEQVNGNRNGVADDSGEHAKDGTRWGSGEAHIVSVEFAGPAPAAATTVASGGPLTIRIAYRAESRIESPVFGLGISTDDGVLISGPNTRFGSYPIPLIEGEGSVSYAIDRLTLLPGRYWVSAAIYDSTCEHPYDHRERTYPLVVTAGHGVWAEERYGVVRLPGEWLHVPATPGARSASDGVVAPDARPRA